MSRRSLKICAQDSYSLKVGQSKQNGAEGRAWSRRQVKASNQRLEKVPFAFFPIIQVRLLEGHRWHGVKTAQLKKKWVQNPAIARIQKTSSPCAKQSHENGHDQRRLISIWILRKILRLTFIFACLKKRATRRGPLIRWGVERADMPIIGFFIAFCWNFIFWIPSDMRIDI